MSQTAEKDSVSIDVRIGQYVKLRDKIKEIGDRHKAELAPLNAALLRLNGVLLEHLNTANADSVSVKGVGTVYKTTKKSASIADKDAFGWFVRQNEKFDLIDWKANSAAVEAFVTNTGTLPPGINFTQVAVVGVRRGDSD